MATKFAEAWERGDYAAMYTMLSDGARDDVSVRRFTRAYREAADVSTLSKVRTAPPRAEGDRVTIPVTAVDPHLRLDQGRRRAPDGRACGRRRRASRGSPSRRSPD